MKGITKLGLLGLGIPLLAGSTSCHRTHPDRIEGIVESIKIIADNQSAPQVQVNTAIGGGFLASGGKVYAGNSKADVSIVMGPIGTVSPSDANLTDRLLVIKAGSRKKWTRHLISPSALLNYISIGDTISVPRYFGSGSGDDDEYYLYGPIGEYFPDDIVKGSFMNAKRSCSLF